MSSLSQFFIATFLFAFYALAASDQKMLQKPDLQYKYGDPIPVFCLNRTIDNGEHVEDSQGRLQYVPFPTCNETGRSLELYFGVERGMSNGC